MSAGVARAGGRGERNLKAGWSCTLFNAKMALPAEISALFGASAPPGRVVLCQGR